MTIEFTLTKRQEETRAAIHNLAESVIRPQSLSWDKNHEIPRDFLQRIAMLANSLGSLSAHAAIEREAATPVDPSLPKKETSVNVSTIVGAEELAWGDAGLLLCLPGPGLGGPPVRATGTPEQRERFFGIFKDLTSDLRWGAYALTEPGAGSDVAGIRTA
jgi:acyl-CoA dehydrogenase